MFTPSLFAEDLDHVLAHTPDVWEELRGQRLFMTGGAGFFGTWLIETFLWANQKLDLGAELLVLSRDPAALLRKRPHLADPSRLGLTAGLGFMAGDMANFEFPAGEFSHVIHAATDAHDSPSAIVRLAAFDHDLAGTRHILDFARRCGAKRILLTSSGAGYGRQPSELTHIPEDYPGSSSPTDTHSGYGQAKRVSEFLCGLYSQAHGLETKIARCFGPIVIQGDGTPYRSYLYAADLAAWLWTILIRGRTCRPYNVGSDQDLTIAALARIVLDVVAPAAELRILQAADPSRPATRYVPETKRAYNELGLGVQIGLGEGICRMAAWHKARLLANG